jgi:hypothetical protein
MAMRATPPFGCVVARGVVIEVLPWRNNGPFDIQTTRPPEKTLNDHKELHGFNMFRNRNSLSVPSGGDILASNWLQKNDRRGEIEMNRNFGVTTLFFAAISILSQSALAVITNPTPQRSYVSTAGSDANNCGFAAPCRTIQAALAQVNPGGEVLVLDSGGYGNNAGANANVALIVITQSVTITVPSGTYAGISPAAGYDGILVNAPGALVMIKGLNIVGQGGTNGINIQNGGVEIKNCTIMGMVNGINMAGSLSGGGFRLEDSSIIASSGDGVLIQPTTTASGYRGADIVSSSIFVSLSNGISIGDGAEVSVQNSTVSNSVLNSIEVNVGSTRDSRLMVSGSSLQGGGTAAHVLLQSASAGIRAYVRNTTIHGGTNGVEAIGATTSATLDNDGFFLTTTAVLNTGAVVNTYGNNRSEGVTTLVSGTALLPASLF